jgi:hypothetical protein
MKKILFSALFLIFISSTLYPLTKEDWDVIRPLFFRGIKIGIATGFGTPVALYGTLYTHNLFNPLGPKNANLAEWRAYYANKTRKIPFIKKISLSDLFVASITTGTVGLYAGAVGAFIHATLYIAHKYNVSYKEAWNAIRYNLDLSSKSKPNKE